MGEGSALCGLELLTRYSPEENGGMETKEGQRQWHLSIQVTKSHESILIRPLSRQVRRAPSLPSEQVRVKGGSKVLELAKMVNAMVLFVLEGTL